jgi:hypothetical protein
VTGVIILVEIMVMMHPNFLCGDFSIELLAIKMFQGSTEDLALSKARQTLSSLECKLKVE